jgi:hypothetical protein
MFGSSVGGEYLPSPSKLSDKTGFPSSLWFVSASFMIADKHDTHKSPLIDSASVSGWKHLPHFGSGSV